MRLDVIPLLMATVFFGLGCRGTATSDTTQIDLDHLSFTLPAGWQQVPPNSTMRVAQATIPGPDGPGEMAVFHFGAGQGGSVEANLQRWIGQVVPDPGETAARQTFDSGALRITWIDVRGTLQPAQMGMGPSTAQPHSRLLGAVVEGDGGPWFFKTTGPDATLAPQRDAFEAMLRTARPRGG